MTKATAFALVCALCVASVMLRAQSNTVNSGATLPAVCMSGSVYITTVTPTLYVCGPANTWTAVTWNGAIPSGAVIFVATGSCPSGYAEVAALNGRMVRGTVAANGNVGANGGSDSVTPTFTGSQVSTSAITAGTPAGSNTAPGFTGSAWVAPVLAWPASVPTYTGTVNTLAVTAHTVVATKQGAASGNVVTTATHTITGIPGGTVAWPVTVPTIAAYTPAGTVAAPVFSGQALATHQHTETAVGTISAVDTKAAFIYLIGCAKT